MDQSCKIVGMSCILAIMLLYLTCQPIRHKDSFRRCLWSLEMLPLTLLCRVFMLRASQLLPHTRFSATEFKKTLNLLPNSIWAGAFKVIGGSTLELTVAQFWSSLGDSSFNMEIKYHGLDTTPNSVMLDGSAQVKKLLLRWDQWRKLV